MGVRSARAFGLTAATAAAAAAMTKALLENFGAGRARFGDEARM